MSEPRRKVNLIRGDADDFDAGPFGDDLPWAELGQRRCKARVEPNGSGYWGRCELRRGHWRDIDHALERGMVTLRWSTGWTS